MAKHIPVVGLAGRRNAGKSSLFNALLGKNRALTHETPGLTRDVLKGEVNRYGMRFYILDLPGLDLEPDNGLDDAIVARAREILKSVDLLIYLMEPPAADAFDIDFIQWLRKENRPLLLVVNKIDAPEKESDIYGFYEDGLDPLPVSAASKYHLKDMCEAVKSTLESLGIAMPPALERSPSGLAEPHWKRRKNRAASESQEDPGGVAIEEDMENESDGHASTEMPDNPDGDPHSLTVVTQEDNAADSDELVEQTMEGSGEGPVSVNLQEPTLTEQEIESIWQDRRRSKEIRSTTISDDRTSDLRISLVGKQNAGKSSLFNRLVNEELSLVSDVAGTTRDTLDTLFRFRGKAIRIIDTAGLKKRGAVKNATDFYSMRRSLRAMQDSEVVVHLIDGLKGISDYDKKIQAMIGRFARPCIMVVNKWDAVPDKDHKTQKNFLLDLKAAFRFLETVPVLFISALTGKNTLKIIEEALALKEKSAYRVSTSELNNRIKIWFRDWPGKNAGFRILYATQPDANPPVFLFFINDKQKMQKGFPRFVENKIRQDFGLQGIPIRVFFRERSG